MSVSARLRRAVSPLVRWVVSKALPEELPEVKVSHRNVLVSETELHAEVKVEYRGRCSGRIGGSDYSSFDGTFTVCAPVRIGFDAA